MEHHLRLAETCERAAGEHDAIEIASRERAKYHEEKGYFERVARFTANSEEAGSDAAALRALATALRGASVMRKNPSEDGRLGALYLTLTLGDA